MGEGLWDELNNSRSVITLRRGCCEDYRRAAGLLSMWQLEKKFQVKAPS
jgi:hypothetical protein